MKLTKILASGCVLGLSSVAMAEDEPAGGWTFIPSIAYQHKQLDFDQLYSDDTGKITNENGRKSSFQVYLPTVNFSFTTAYKKLYVALKYEQSLADGSDEVDETRPASRSAVSDPYYLNVPGHETKVERSDASITFGANVWRGLNVFTGYMEGRTRLTPEPTCYTYPLPCSALNLAVDLENEKRGEYRQKYTEKGPYVGLSYGWQIGDAGTLSASFAYAEMKGTFTDNYVTTSYGDEHFNFTGDSIGTSLGVTWSSPLGESSSYFFDLRQQKYSMKGRDHDTPSTYLDTVKVKTDETMLGLTMGLQYFF